MLVVVSGDAPIPLICRHVEVAVLAVHFRNIISLVVVKAPSQVAPGFYLGAG